MKSGDLAMLKLQYFSTTFLPTSDGWDGWAHETVIHCGEFILLLNEDVLRSTRVFKVFHCPSQKVGFIRPEKLYKVNS